MLGALRAFTDPASYRRLAFLASAVPLGLLWLALLSSVWGVTVSVAITPLVVPAVICVCLVVRAGAAVEVQIARRLLGADLSPPRWPRQTDGLWRYFLSTFSDPALWRTQAYLLLRAVLGSTVAVILLSVLIAAIGLIAAPVLYFAIPGGVDVGHTHIHSLALALVAVPVGVLAEIGVMAALAPLARPWYGLSVALLKPGAEVLPSPRPARQRALVVHAITFAGVSLFLTLIWALTSRGYFWPVWAILVLAVPLAIHAWVVQVGRRPEVWARRRLSPAFAIHAGVWAISLVFLSSVWAITSRGYFWPVWVMLLAGVAVGAHAAALLLRSTDEEALTARISALESSRAGAVDVQEAELRRIERDLHDGAQARLVALGMSLGMAEQKFSTDADAARELLAEARAGAGEALRELRDLARGVHPPVLADRGLEAAVRALAAASPQTVTVSVVIPERPKAPVESAAYFIVAESLANAGKHAGATRLDVRIIRNGENLSVEVHDDGKGGADPAGGGLSGLRRRVEALDGTLAIISPPGGPTTIRAELPCG
jgi:signal transduction histidine kinase